MKVPTRTGPTVLKRIVPDPGLPRFAPGDLITAEQLNMLVDAVAALRARVAALEAGPPK